MVTTVNAWAIRDHCSVDCAQVAETISNCLNLSCHFLEFGFDCFDGNVLLRNPRLETEL